MSWTTTPMDAKIAAAAGSLAFSTELQHWIAPVLHVEAGALLGAAVATARIAARVKTLENMLVREAGSSELLLTVRWGLCRLLLVLLCVFPCVSHALREFCTPNGDYTVYWRPNRKNNLTCSYPPFPAKRDLYQESDQSAR